MVDNTQPDSGAAAAWQAAGGGNPSASGGTSAVDAWKSAGGADNSVSFTGEHPLAGYIADHAFDTGPLKRIGNAFGQTLEDNYGGGHAPELEDWLRKKGIWNDYAAGQSNIYKGFAESFGRQAIRAALLAGSGFQAVGATIDQAGGEMLNRARDIYEKAGQEPSTFLGDAFGIAGKAAAVGLGIEGELTAGRVEGYIDPAVTHGHLPAELDLNKYRSTGSIGEDDATYFGLKKPSPNDLKARNDATARAPIQPIKPDIHTVARGIAPDIFQKEDALKEQQQSLRTTLDKLPPDAPEREVIQKQLDTANKQRLSLQDDISTAYKLAAEDSGEAVQPRPEVKGGRGFTEEDARVQGAIQDHITNTLIAAGRPEEEAEALGRSMGAYYITRAGRLGMDANDLFQRDFPDVRLEKVDQGEKGALYQYAGIRSDAVPLPALNKALQMERAGEDMEKIRVGTGWFRSKLDKKWRYEFSDKDSKFNFDQVPDSPLLGKTNPVNLDQVLTHDKLFQHYPEARNIKVTKRGVLMDPWQSVQGGFHDDENTINITPYAKDPHSTLLHEIQHWIQKKEGFARGGNSSTVLDKLPPERVKGLFEETIRKTQDNLSGIATRIDNISKFVSENEQNIARLLDLEDKKEELWYKRKKADKDGWTNTDLQKVTDKEFGEAYTAYTQLKHQVLGEFFGVKSYFDLNKDQVASWNDLTRLISRVDGGTETSLITSLKDEFVKQQDLLSKLQMGDKDALKSALGSDRAHQLYEAIAGEIEARDVQARAAMSDEERAAQEPGTSQKYNPEDVTVSFEQNDRRAEHPIVKEARDVGKVIVSDVMDAINSKDPNIIKSAIETASSDLYEWLDRDHPTLQFGEDEAGASWKMLTKLASKLNNELYDMAHTIGVLKETGGKNDQALIDKKLDQASEFIRDLGEHLDDPTPFEQKQGKGAPRGSLTPIKGGRNILRLFQGQANASTFIHEFGHQSLEDLLSDAAREDAPDDIKQDAAIVRKYLRISDKPTKAAHERWARTMERYFMEGHAPSPELAAVFEKIAKWITSVYENLTKNFPELKRDLSPEVKGVLDRMYNNQGKGFTVAPETPPELSEVSAGEGFGEGPSKQGPEEATPNIQSGIKPDKATEINPTVGPPKEAYSQSDYIGSDGKVKLDKITSNESLGNYINAWGEKFGDFVTERAGKLSSQDILDFAETVGDSPRRVRANIRKMMATMGDPTEVFARVMAIKQALVENTTRLETFRISGDVEKFALAQELQYELWKSYNLTRTSWARMGHALNTSLEAMGERAILEKAEMLDAFFQQNYGKSSKEIMSQMDGMKWLKGDPTKLSKQAIRNARATMGDKVLEWVRMNYITGPITHATYSLGNKLFAFSRAFPEALATAGISKVQSLVNPDAERVYAREAFAQTAELFRQWFPLSTITDGLVAGKVRLPSRDTEYNPKAAGYTSTWLSFYNGDLAALPGEGTAYDLARHRVMEKFRKEGTPFKESDPGFKKQVDQVHQNLIEQMAAGKAKAEGLEGDDFVKRVKELSTDRKLFSQIVDKPQSIYTKTKAIEGTLGTVARAAGERFVGPIHAFDRAVSYEWHRKGLVVRRAMDEGFRGKDLQNRIAELLDDTPEEIMAQARDQTWEDALLGKAGDFTKRYNNFLNWRPGGIPVGGFIEPFVNIPAQLIRTSVYERGPFGLIGSLFDTDLHNDVVGKNGDIAQANSIAKLSLGTTVGLGFMMLSFEQMGNGYQSKDYKEARVDLLYKGLPNSIRIGNMTYAVDKLGPIGVLASYWMTLGRVARLAEEGDYKKAVEYGIYATAQVPAEIYGGWADWFDAAHKGIDGLSKEMENMILNGVMPYGVASKQIADQIDPYKRVADSFLDKLIDRIPLASAYELKPQRDIFGQPVPNKEFWGVYAQHVDNDPVVGMLEQEGYFPAPVKKDIKGVPLNDEQYDEYSMLSGIALRQELEFDMSLPGWETFSKTEKHDIIVKAVASTRRNAANTLAAKYYGTGATDIGQKANDLKEGLTDDQ